MSKPIDLQHTGFRLTEAVPFFRKFWPTCGLMTKDGLIEIADFGTILIGFDQLSDPKHRDLVLELAGTGPLFKAPEDWGWPQIAKALGFFKSSTEARKNGWGDDIEQGWNQKIGRIRKVKGLVVVFKVTPELDSEWAAIS